MIYIWTAVRFVLKTKSTPTSLPIKGQVTKHTTVKWVPNSFHIKVLTTSFLGVYPGNEVEVLFENCVEPEK